MKTSPRCNLINNFLNDSDRSLYTISFVIIAAAYKRGTRYLSILILAASSLRSSIFTANKL